MKDPFSLLPSPHYNNALLWLLLVVCLLALIGGFIYKRYMPSGTKNSQGDAAADIPISGPPKQTQTSSRTMNRHLALSYLKELKQAAQKPEAQDLSPIYVALSYVVRQYVDTLGGTNTIAMSSQEVRQLQVDTLFQKILEQCYEAEFSAHHGSQENCLALLEQAEEFIKR